MQHDKQDRSNKPDWLKQPVFAALPVPLLTPRLSSYWLKFITRGDIYMARELVEGLKTDLLAKDDTFWEMIDHTERVPFEEAARRASQLTAPDSRLSRIYEGIVRVVSRPRTP